MRQQASREPRRAVFTAGDYPAITPSRIWAAPEPRVLRSSKRPHGEVRWLTATLLGLALLFGFTLQRTRDARARERAVADARAQADSLALAATRDSLRAAREQLVATTQAVARAVRVWEGPPGPLYAARLAVRRTRPSPLVLRRQAAAFSSSPASRAAADRGTPRPTGTRPE
jgi:hypothetical protein